MTADNIVAIITAIAALVTAIGGLFYVGRKGLKVGQDEKPSEISYRAPESYEHERTRDLIRDQTSMIRSRFSDMDRAIRESRTDK